MRSLVHTHSLLFTALVLAISAPIQVQSNDSKLVREEIIVTSCKRETAVATLSTSVSGKYNSW